MKTEYITFLEALKTDTNTELLETVINGYVLIESSPMLDRLKASDKALQLKKRLKAMVVAGTMSLATLLGSYAGVFDDKELIEIKEYYANQLKPSQVSDLIVKYNEAELLGDDLLKAKLYDQLKANNIRRDRDKNYFDSYGREYSPEGKLK